MPQTPPCVACGEPLVGWTGHSCYKCVQGLAEQRDDLFDEVMKLRYELKNFKEGIPIEKAKTDGTVYNYYVAAEEQWEHVEWAEALGWHYWDYYCDRAEIVHPERLYPLPSTETKVSE